METIKWKRGDLHLVDCVVTDSSEGIDADPKCSLKYLMKSSVFLEVKRLVCSGGKYEEYFPGW